MSQNPGNPSRNLTGNDSNQQFISNSQSQQQTQQTQQQQKQQQLQLLQQLQRSGMNIPPQVLQNPNLLQTYLNFVLQQRQQATNGNVRQNSNTSKQPTFQRQNINVQNPPSSSSRSNLTPNSSKQNKNKITGTKRSAPPISDQEQMKRLRTVYEQKYPQAMNPDYKTKFKDFQDLRTRLKAFDVFENTFNPLSKEEYDQWQEKLSSIAENFLKHESKLESHFERRLKRISEATASIEDCVFVERLSFQSESESIKESVERFARRSKEDRQKYITQLQEQQKILQERRQKHERHRLKQQKKKEAEKKNRQESATSSQSSNNGTGRSIPSGISSGNGSGSGSGNVVTSGNGSNEASSSSPAYKPTPPTSQGSPMQPIKSPSPSHLLTPQSQSSPVAASTPLSTPQSTSNSPAANPTPPPQLSQQQPQLQPQPSQQIQSQPQPHLYMQSNAYANQQRMSSPIMGNSPRNPQQNNQNQIALQLLNNMNPNNSQGLRSLNKQQLEFLRQQRQLHQKQQPQLQQQQLQQHQQPYQIQQLQQPRQPNQIQQNPQLYMPSGNYNQSHAFGNQGSASPSLTPQPSPQPTSQAYWNSGGQGTPTQGSSSNAFGNTSSISGWNANDGSTSFYPNSYMNPSGVSQTSITSPQPQLQPQQLQQSQQQQQPSNSLKQEEENTEFNIQDFFA